MDKVADQKVTKQRGQFLTSPIKAIAPVGQDGKGVALILLKTALKRFVSGEMDEFMKRSLHRQPMNSLLINQSGAFSYGFKLCYHQAIPQIECLKYCFESLV